MGRDWLFPQDLILFPGMAEPWQRHKAATGASGIWAPSPKDVLAASASLNPANVQAAAR